MRRVLTDPGGADGVRGDYFPRAHMTLLQKDTRLAVAAAHAAGFTGPLGAAAAQVFEDAANAGFAHEDDAAVFKLIQSTPNPTIPP
jgi:3-hydroxyisobutyrate dehydrogenase-like beta-hydroxyacid dehydrogenase